MNLISRARYSSGIQSFGLDEAAALNIFEKLLLTRCIYFWHGLASLPNGR